MAPINVASLRKDAYNTIARASEDRCPSPCAILLYIQAR